MFTTAQNTVEQVYIDVEHKDIFIIHVLCTYIITIFLHENALLMFFTNNNPKYLYGKDLS